MIRHTVRGRPAPGKQRLPNGQLDTEGAAKMMGVSASTLRVWRFRGIGPKSWTTDIGRVRYWVCDVEAWTANKPDIPQ